MGLSIADLLARADPPVALSQWYRWTEPNAAKRTSPTFDAIHRILRVREPRKRKP